MSVTYNKPYTNSIHLISYTIGGNIDMDNNNSEHITHHEGRQARNTILSRKRSGIIPIGSTVMTLTDDGFLDLEVGYVAREAYRYFLKNATLSKRSDYLFVHRYELTLQSEQGEKPLCLPVFSGLWFADKLKEALNNVPNMQSRNGENKTGFPPKRKIADWIISTILVILLLLGMILFAGGNHKITSADEKSDMSTKQSTLAEAAISDSKLIEEIKTTGNDIIKKTEDAINIGIDEYNRFDRQSFWHSVLPHTEATPDTSLNVAFVVILLVMLGTFMPTKIMRIITLSALIACIVTAIIIIYPLMDTSDNLLKQALFAIAPLLLAFVVSIIIYLYSRAIDKKRYHLFERVGFLFSLVLALVSMWIFAYGYLYHHGFDRSLLPNIYPNKILQLSKETYIYVAAGTLFLMLFIGSVFKAGKYAGTLGSFVSFLFLCHLLYEKVCTEKVSSFDVKAFIPALIMTAMIIVSFIFKGYGKKHIN